MCLLTPEASWIQSDLLLLSLDGYSPDMLIGGRGGPRDPRKWQYAIDVLHSGLLSGLVGVWEGGKPSAMSENDLRSLVVHLSLTDPFDAGLFKSGGLDQWLELQIYGTEICDNLLQRHQIKRSDDPLAMPFISELKQTFIAASAPWGAGPRVRLE